MNDFDSQDLKLIEELLTARLISDIQYSLRQFNKFSSQYFGWEKQREIKRECLKVFSGFYL